MHDLNSMGANLSILETFDTGLWFNTTILGLAVVVIVYSICFWYAVTRETLAPHSFTDEFGRLTSCQRWEDAILLCHSHADLFLAPILERLAKNRTSGHAALLEIVRSECRVRGKPLLDRSIGPALGGTLACVVGFVGLLRSLLPDSLNTWGHETLYLGLLVLVVGLVLSKALDARLTKVLGNVERDCHALADALAQEAGDTPGARIRALAEEARRRIAAALGQEPRP